MSPMKRTDFIVPAKFAKSEEFEISLEVILWDSDTIVCINNCK